MDPKGLKPNKSFLHSAHKGRGESITKDDLEVTQKYNVTCVK